MPNEQFDLDAIRDALEEAVDVTRPVFSFTVTTVTTVIAVVLSGLALLVGMLLSR